MQVLYDTSKKNRGEKRLTLKKKIVEYLHNLCYDLFKIWGGKMDKTYSAMEVARTLIYIANSRQIDITNLKLQKLLYFCEAYYMCVEDTCKMFNEEFNALTFGPVVLEVYNNYKSNLSYPIELSEEEKSTIIVENCQLGQSYINTINQVLDSFGTLSASQLVALTHMTDSPWEKIWKKNNETSNYEENGVVSKEETKSWFKKVFINEQR